MALKPQTAIRGVLSVGLINATARLIAYGKHIVITAYIGLSAQLDAFYMATTVLALTVFVFGDVFDSLGVPRLVKTLQAEGEEGFRDLAESILSFAFLLAAGLGLLLLLVAPWTPWIAPGFSPEKKGFVLKNLFYLAPMAMLFLPYHAMGSFLRAKRRFQAFYLGEIVIAGVTLLVVLFWHELPYVIPVSFSVAYVAAFLFVVCISWKDVRFRFSIRNEKMREILRMLIRLLPIYLVFHLFTLVDRAFASFLPTGGVSALSYGLMIVLIPSSILMMENIFITPLSESQDKDAMMREIAGGILIISVPVAFFTAVHADQIVRVAFERGVFTAGSTQMTGDALAYFALAIPAYFLWPIFYRLFQILGQLGSISLVAYLGVLLNGALNYLFMRLGMGIKGLALATALANYGIVLGSLVLFHRSGISIATSRIAKVLAVSIGVGLFSLAVTFAVPRSMTGATGILMRGTVFLLAAGFLYSVVPNEEVRRWKETVLKEIFPGRSGPAAS